MKLHSSKERYLAEFPFISWLFTICRNTMLDHLKKAARQQKFF